MEIYGTIGPACAGEETIRQMMEAGMTGMRLNLSHTTLEDAKDQIEIFHRAAKRAGKQVRLLIDMQGPELRMGRLSEPIPLEKGLEYEDLPFPSSVCEQLQVGDRILMDDGILKGEMVRFESGKPVIRISRGGLLFSGKSVAIEGKSVTGPAVSQKDRENLANAVKYGVTDIMQPFVRNGEDLKQVRNAMKEAGCPHLKLLAKIENPEGAAHLDSILKEADEIVIARGDLGSNMPLWELPAVQKQISHICKQEEKPFMVVTQMLSSMIHSPVPTRAEVSDIFNAVLDGAASVMVTGETAVGEYPVEVIKYMVNTVAEGLKYKNRLLSDGRLEIR